MATVNVNRENPDQFYRYKMPLLIAKVVGEKVPYIGTIKYAHAWHLRVRWLACMLSILHSVPSLSAK